MLPKASSKLQRGYVGLAVIVFMLILAMLIYPNVFPTGGGSGGCRAGSAPTISKIVTWPAIDGGETALPVEEQPTSQYRLIRENVPVTSFLTIFHAEAWGSSKNAVHISGIQYLNENEYLLYPKKNFGEHTIEAQNGKPQRGIHLFAEGLVFVMKMDGPGAPKVIATRLSEGAAGQGIGEESIWTVDVYQELEMAKTVERGNAAYTWDELFQCDGGGPLPSNNPFVVVPSQESSPDRDELQLEWFLLDKSQGVWGTHCKPAVYLYPEKKQLVNLRVFPKGELSYTDPPYDKTSGWFVEAYPDGSIFDLTKQESSIFNQGKKYDYLYYESKLLDSEIKKPQEGWVVQGSRIKDQGSSELERLFDEVLPKLGLNAKEKADFEEYWLNKLPEAPYYFVGLVDKQQRDYLERLSVTPEPETSIRFSLFFEMLEEPKVVREPSIGTPKREGFTLVDWGGMIKLHPGTEFTCSE